jgi:hypothetical protein
MHQARDTRAEVKARVGRCVAAHLPFAKRTSPLPTASDKQRLLDLDDKR